MHQCTILKTIKPLCYGHSSALPDRCSTDGPSCMSICVCRWISQSAWNLVHDPWHRPFQPNNWCSGRISAVLVRYCPNNNVCHICSRVANRPSSRDATIFWSFVLHLGYIFLGMQISGFPTGLTCWESVGNPMTPPDHHLVIDMVKSESSNFAMVYTLRPALAKHS